MNDMLPLAIEPFGHDMYPDGADYTGLPTVMVCEQRLRTRLFRPTWTSGVKNHQRVTSPGQIQSTVVADTPQAFVPSADGLCALLLDTRQHVLPAIMRPHIQGPLVAKIENWPQYVRLFAFDTHTLFLSPTR